VKLKLLLRNDLIRGVRQDGGGRAHLYISGGPEDGYTIPANDDGLLAMALAAFINQVPVVIRGKKEPGRSSGRLSVFMQIGKAICQ